MSERLAVVDSSVDARLDHEYSVLPLGYRDTPKPL